MTYTTISGDTFDSIAFNLLGNKKYTKELMEVNKQQISTVIFAAGTVLNLPEISNQNEVNSSNLPPWRS